MQNLFGCICFHIVGARKFFRATCMIEVYSNFICSFKKNVCSYGIIHCYYFFNCLDIHLVPKQTHYISSLPFNCLYNYQCKCKKKSQEEHFEKKRHTNTIFEVSIKKPEDFCVRTMPTATFEMYEIFVSI